MSSPKALQKLYRLEKSSSRFPAQIAAILDGTEYKVCIKSLQDNELVWLVEYLDTILRAPETAETVSEICLRELRRICGIHRTLPRSYTVPGLPLNTNGKAIDRGYYGDVHVGSLNGSKVRVKRLFTPPDGAGQNVTKDFYEEAVIWKRLNHPNVAPLLGITISPSPPQLISDWASGGNLTEYIRGHPGADQLGLLSGAASGLEYLHSIDVVHGSMKGPNILVDDSGQARITDFGLATIPQDPASKRAFHDDQSVRWTAPEILGNIGSHSKEADVFSFAMVVIEVFTGAIPFDTSTPSTATIAIMQGHRPPRPSHITCSDELWILIQRCWHQDSRSRPEMSEVFHLLPSSALDKLRRLHNPAMASHEFQLALGRFYASPGYQDRVESLQDTDLEEFVDFLDTVLRTKGLNQSLLRQTLHNLRSVCSDRAQIPSSCVISEGLRKSGSRSSLEANQCPGVWFGKLNRAQGGSSKNDVPVKVMKFDKTQKELYGEIATWAWLDHSNILQCFGVTTNPLQVVTEFPLKGNIIEYVQTQLHADRVFLLMDVAQGLEHLHSYGVIHRGLESKNVFVNDAGRACLSNIGFTTFTDTEESDEDDTESCADGSRWMAPEVLTNGKFSKRSDVFSFGFVAAEVLAGEFFWGEYSVVEVRSKISKGERLRMPKGKVDRGVTAEMWAMLTRCWETEATERITISGVLNFLQYTPQPSSKVSPSLETVTARSRYEPGQELIDELDEILEGNDVSDQERAGFLNILRNLCCSQQSVPKSMRIHYSDYDQATKERHGGYAHVFRSEDRGRPVAIKVVRLYLTNDTESCLSRFCKEVVAWKHLRHPNVLPLLGVNLEPNRYAMVFEWMENGNINEFTQKHKEVNRVQLLADAALGLDYMHGIQFIHGDLKGANILVTKDRRACLADFGLSTILHATHHPNTDPCSASLASTTSLVSLNTGGTRWTSPELLRLDRDGPKEFQQTTQSDCYALGMVVYEVLLGKAPYQDVVGDDDVVDTVLKGMRPRKPYEADRIGFTDGLWRIVERSWMEDPDARPDVKTMLHHLSRAASTWNRRQPA